MEFDVKKLVNKIGIEIESIDKVIEKYEMRKERKNDAEYMSLRYYYGKKEGMEKVLDIIDDLV